MGLPKTIRLEDELESKVEEFLQKNSIKFPQLVNMALKKFISEPQTIELVPVDNETWTKATQKAYKKHKHAMDKLK